MTDAEIKKIADENYFGVVGVRVDSRIFAVGDAYPESRRWEDEKPTDDTCDGTSAIGLIDNEEQVMSIQKALDILEPYKINIGKDAKTYLIGGIYKSYGEDPNELVIEDAVVMAVIS